MDGVLAGMPLFSLRSDFFAFSRNDPEHPTFAPTDGFRGLCSGLLCEFPGMFWSGKLYSVTLLGPLRGG